ncbi:hypothetical protein [Roseibium sp. SCP14]|uniref:hypothetical protein n=1 Tax=Roseibium sp. SCP14 TaxID=3141375 RepID=UPI0033370D07
MHKRELQEARPLLQAIVVGLLLATGLMAAAAMANPEAERQATQEPIVLEADPLTEKAPDIHTP